MSGLPVMAWIVLAGLVLAPGPRVAAAADRPPVVLMIIDTLRGDHLGCAGREGLRTPAIDGLARDGVRFASCSSTAPWTLPSVASIYTGRIAWRHGAVGGQHARLPDGEITLAERLADAGYATGGFATINYLDAKFGMAQGFERFELLTAGRGEREADRVANLGAKFATGHAGAPFFLMLHWFDVHAPYRPPAPYDRMYYAGDEKAPGKPITDFLLSDANRARNRESGLYEWLVGVTDLQYPVRQYAAGVSYVDAQVGRVLDALRRAGLYDRALIVLCADHGEHLGEHDIWFTHYLPYQEALHVPLIVKLPGNREAGRVVDAPVSTLDIAPTIAELAGLPAPADVDGRSLVPALAGAEHGRSLLLAEQGSFDRGFSKSLVEWPWKLILFRSGSREVYELYDLEADPGEARNLAHERKGVRNRLRDRIWKICDRRSPVLRDAAERPAEVDAETDRKLRALGY